MSINRYVRIPTSQLRTLYVFELKINSIQNKEGSLMWREPYPNSPYSTHPVTFLALPENLINVEFSSITAETSLIEESGLSL